MAQALISFPFRLTASGAVTTRPDGDVEYLAEELALLTLTRPGERPLVPTYGLNDPTFAEIDIAMLSAQVEIFGPPVEITGIRTRWIDGSTQDVVVEFEELPADEADDDDSTQEE